MQRGAFRDKISRREIFYRRLTSRKPTFSITEYIKNIQTFDKTHYGKVSTNGFM